MSGNTLILQTRWHASDLARKLGVYMADKFNRISDEELATEVATRLKHHGSKRSTLASQLLTAEAEAASAQRVIAFLRAEVDRLNECVLRMTKPPKSYSVEVKHETPYGAIWCSLPISDLSVTDGHVRITINGAAS